MREINEGGVSIILLFDCVGHICDFDDMSFAYISMSLSWYFHYRLSYKFRPYSWYGASHNQDEKCVILTRVSVPLLIIFMVT